MAKGPKVESSKAQLYRRLPSVDELLRRPEVAALLAREDHALVAESAREVLEQVRAEIGAGRLDAAGVELAVSGLAVALERQVWQSLRPSLRAVINATGV